MNKTIGRLIAAALLLTSSSAFAETYPDRTVTIIVTSAAGALTDVLTRAVGQQLSQMWGQPVVIENRGGAGHNLAAGVVARAEHDGYTLLSSESGFVTSQPHLYAKGKFPYDAATDFIPIAAYAGIPEALLINPSVPANTVAELIALARQKPGSLNYGTAGVGTAPHTAALLFESLTGTKLTAVHYRGVAPALTDLLAGHINMIIMGPSVALPAVRAGTIKMLGFASEKRMPQFPDVPTIAETVPGFDASVSFGLFGPAGMPPEVVTKINADVQHAIANPEFRAKFLEPLVVQSMPGSQQAFADYLGKEFAKWAKVIEGAHLKIE